MRPHALRAQIEFPYAMLVIGSAGLPALLPLSSIAVVAVYFVFAVLLAMVGRVEGIDRNSPLPWERLAFATLMRWLAAHTLMPCARRRQHSWTEP